MRERPQFGSLLRILQRQTIPNSWILRVPPKQRERDARECRRRERKSFGAFFVGFRRSGRVYHCFGKKCTKQVFSECFRFTCSRARGFGARLQSKQEKMFASAECASGENLRHSMRVLCKCTPSRHCAWQTKLKTQYFENAPKSLIHEYMGFARASRTK